jgi:Uma2 family endonuclease
MAAASQPVNALLTLEEYLHTVYHPDCDFVDGHLEERNLGETAHGLLQVELSYWFRSRSEEWKIRVITELRTRVATSRVRIPDVSVVPDDAALAERVRQTPPLIAIEIMSPEDRTSRVVKRLDDFVRMGIENIWLLDPDERVAYTYSKFGLKLSDSDRLTVEGTPIFLDVTAIFSALPSGL